MNFSPGDIRTLRGQESQKVFAKRLGCTWVQISRWEHGHAQPSPVFRDKLRRITASQARKERYEQPPVTTSTPATEVAP